MFSGLFRSVPSKLPPQRSDGAAVTAQAKYNRASKGASAAPGKVNNKAAQSNAERRPDKQGSASKKSKKDGPPSRVAGSGQHGDAASVPSVTSKKKHRQKLAAAAANSKSQSTEELDLPKATGKKRKRRLSPGGLDTQPAAPKLLLSAVAAGSSSVGRAAERLKGSRFRWLNDTLYSITGSEAKNLYDKDPTLATAYHDGFRAQRAKWPRDPLDDVIGWLRREIPKEAVIGDFGCGEARLALELKGYKVNSFDLLPVNERVTACNLAAVPLPDGSIDVAVFCLALMGTDWPKFLAEAHRCLRPKGLLHIVEVESRFADVNAVVKLIERIGFRKVLFRPGNFFLELRFARTGGGGEDREAGGGREGAHRSTKARRRARRQAVADSGPASAQSGELLQGCVYRRR